MIFRNIVDRNGYYCGVYQLVQDKIYQGRYTWVYVVGTQGLPLNDNFFTIRKEANGWSFPFIEGDLDDNGIL